MRAQAFWITLLPAMLLLTACGEPPGPESGKSDQSPSSAELSGVIRDQVDQLSTSVCESAKNLKAGVKAFLDSPDPETLINARAQWRRAHQSYADLVVAYKLAGQELPNIHEDRDTLDAYPLLPGYLDRVPGYPRSGIVYSEVPLTPAFLQEEHQSTDFLYLTLGFHPLETMLWGSADQTTDEQVVLYTKTDSVDKDQIDSRSRRADLLRLIAHGLNRDAGMHCPPAGLIPVMSELTRLKGSEDSAKQAIAEVLGALIEPRLSAWQTNTVGEDRNGMPVWHAPFAKTDFTEMSAQVNALRTQWLPALAPNAADADSRSVLEERFAVLAERLDQHAAAGSNQTVDDITHTRDELNALLAALSPAPQREESSQSDAPPDPVDNNEQALGPLDSEESRE